MAAAAAPLGSSMDRHALPDPGEPVPELALPTVAIFAAALAAWCLATWAALGGHAPIWATIPVHAAVSFVMFTVAHDASHYAISRVRWVNGLLGRLAMPFVVAYTAFPAFAYIHIEHHRHTNELESDPDSFATRPGWSTPLKWFTTDLHYMRFYLARRLSRPVAESAEGGVMMLLFVGGVIACAATGNFWNLAIVYLIPQRVALGILGWWFDWLPHHGLPFTQRENRYRATRARVGMEWLFTPLMLSQNYHLIHHLHPSVPFYRYLSVWKRNEPAYLEREAAIATVFGHQLTPAEYKVWTELQSAFARMRRVIVPEGSTAPHAIFHRVRVAEVSRLTEDSVLVGFDVPEDLRDHFRFTQGQHLTVRTDLGGEGVRRNYSICSPATTGTLRIAVKHIPGGAFSSFAMDQLKAGDDLELMTPTGMFSTELEPNAKKNYVAVAAGSGITPILSIVATTLEIEADSRFTLIYGNRTRQSTMFREELDQLESRFADRLEILHVHSREPHRNPLLTGRIDRAKLETLLSTSLGPDTVDEWFLCGPMELTVMARETLLEHEVEQAHIHLELFYGYSDADSEARPGAGPCTVTVTLDGEESTVELVAGDTILEAALQQSLDAPYACMGGACGTCRAKLLDGTVEMDHNFALGGDDLERGYVLTCQSRPTSPTVRVDYDS